MSKDAERFMGVHQVLKLVEQRVQLESALSGLRRHQIVLDEPVQNDERAADIAGMHSVVFEASHTTNVRWSGRDDGGELQRILTREAMHYFEAKLHATDKLLAKADNKLRVVLGLVGETVAKKENVAVVETCKDEPAPEVREEEIPPTSGSHW